MKKSLLAIALATLAGPVLADTAAPAAPAPSYTLTANVDLSSQYIYRGLTQTNGNPAIQGGADLTMANGFYLGTWGSNISWFSDANPAPASSLSMEWDLYGGYAQTIGDYGYNVGVLQYYYDGSYGNLYSATSGTVNPNTTEIYALVSYKTLSFKVSDVVSTGLFGVADASGSYYADLSWNPALTDTLTLNTHVGEQKYTGTSAFGKPSNDSLYSYTDYKLGITADLSKELGTGWSGTAYYTYANTSGIGFTNSMTSNIGGSRTTVAIARTF
ncbi:MAG: TorF family putative porin [Betaproteobacteria bacterium]|nr:TorF family putative porin [Betaproteobacteria bacterium]